GGSMDDGAMTSSAKQLLEPVIAAIGTSAMVTRYVAAVLIIAAAERGAIDPDRVFSLLATLADGFDAGAGGNAETARLTALTLRQTHLSGLDDNSAGRRARVGADRKAWRRPPDAYNATRPGIFMKRKLVDIEDAVAWAAAELARQGPPGRRAPLRSFVGRADA